MTLKDIDITNNICGKDIFSLKGNTTSKKTIPVTEYLIQVPKDLINLHMYFVMTADILFDNKIPLFLTLSWKICFTMVHHLANMKVRKMYNAFNEVYIYYRMWGFSIITLHIDGYFSPLQAMIIEHTTGGPTINLTSENEHVLEIYCRIRVVKEIEIRVRQSIPLNRIPRLFLIYIIFVSVKMINNFPTKGGTSTVYSPNIIMSGETFHYNIHLTLKIGHYCQVHDEDTP